MIASVKPIDPHIFEIPAREEKFQKKNEDGIISIKVSKIK